MLKIEVIKFEAMDVITASTAAPTEPAPVVDPCAEAGHKIDVKVENGMFNATCSVCGKSYVGPGPFTGEDLK